MSVKTRAVSGVLGIMKAMIGFVLMIAIAPAPLLCAQYDDDPAQRERPADPSSVFRQGTLPKEGAPSPRSLSRPKQWTVSPILSGTTSYRPEPSGQASSSPAPGALPAKTP